MVKQRSISIGGNDPDAQTDQAGLRQQRNIAESTRDKFFKVQPAFYHLLHDEQYQVIDID